MAERSTERVDARGFKRSFYAFLRRVVLWESSSWLKLYPAYHLRRFLYGYAIVPVNGFRMYVDLRNDAGISKDLFIFRKREHLSTDLLVQGKIVTSGDVVLDIGANIGYYALLESRLVGSEGTVYAIEPVLNNFRLLEKNIALNGITNVRAFQLAAGNKNGEAEIHIAEKGNLSSFIYRADNKFTGTQKVNMVTVDGFVARHQIRPALVRMDVEGYEVEIIEGMRQTLLLHPKLLIEVHSNLVEAGRLERMFKTIAENGYHNAVVVKERNQLWMRRDGDIRPVLRHLTNAISKDGYALGMGKIERVSLDELRGSLKDRSASFHALVS